MTFILSVLTFVFGIVTPSESFNGKYSSDKNYHNIFFSDTDKFMVRNVGVKPDIPFFRTLKQSGSAEIFDKQFREFENTPGQGNIKSMRSRTESVAERVLNDVDLTVNPCDNFYKFACGGYMKNTNRTNGVSNAFLTPEASITEVIKEELQKKCFRNDPKPLLKAKKFFRSCMDENYIERRGIEPVLHFLADSGGWPVLGSWNHKKFDFVDLLARTRPLVRSGSIIGIQIFKDFGQKKGYAIYLNQPSLGQFNLFGFPNEEIYHLGRNNIYNKVYEEYLIDVAIALGANPNVAKRDMRDVMTFETALAASILPEEEIRRWDLRYNKITIRELAVRYPQIDWLRFIRKVLSIANIKVNLNSKVVLWVAPYYDRLVKILAHTSERTLANYILFRAIQSFLPSLTKHLRYVTLRYNAVINGENEPRLPERSGFCTQIVNANMDWITSRIYIENRSYGDTIAYTNRIKDYVRFIFTDMIKRADWLSKITKNRALEKMNAIQDKIGFPEELLQKGFLENYYKNFDISKGFFENMEETLTENFKIVVGKLVNPPESEWLIRPSTVNALHNFGTTSIEIPLGILNEPFFSNDYAPSMNFGGIGFFIAHEYGHGYDVRGTITDLNGIIRQYWSEYSFANFANRADCLVDQYSRYYLPEVDLLIKNGNKTLAENIADTVGTVGSFYAYKKWKKDMNIHDSVPGLPFTGEQLFFINNARVWCLNSTPLFLRKFPLLDPHAINQLRVIGPFQNMPEFSKVFQCPLGSFMNPVKKCRFF